MSEEIGPGAGRTSDPNTAVVTERIAALDRHLTSEIAALRRETHAANAAAEAAVGVAAKEATERLSAHNGLIEQMRQQAALFATRESFDDFRETNDRRLKSIESWTARVTGGLIIVGFIGVANLVKIWTG